MKTHSGTRVDAEEDETHTRLLSARRSAGTDGGRLTHRSEAHKVEFAPILTTGKYARWTASLLTGPPRLGKKAVALRYITYRDWSIGAYDADDPAFLAKEFSKVHRAHQADGKLASA